MAEEGSGVWRRLVKALGERRVRRRSLARMTTLRVGDHATVVEPRSAEELAAVMEIATGDAVEVALVGLGSNLIADDFSGVVVRQRGGLTSVEVVERDSSEAIVEVGAGAVNAHVVRDVHAAGYVGCEFLALVPGTIGGAVVMNAGTRWGELSEIVTEARLMLPSGELRWVERASLGLRYRHSALPEGAWVVGARFRVRAGDVEAAREAVRQEKAYREATQPYKLATHGSVFANPPGDAAGRLLDVAGMKGAREGGAVVSEKHANWIVNTGEAEAEDVLRLMARMRARVRARFDVALRPEVRLLSGRAVESVLEELEEESGDD